MTLPIQLSAEASAELVVLDDRIRILAVAHDRRRPVYWAPRANS